MASFLADQCESDLIEMNSDQNRLLDEAITMMEHLDPKFEVNTQDQVKSTIQQYMGRQNVFTDRITEMLDQVVQLKETIRARQAAELAT